MEPKPRLGAAFGTSNNTGKTSWFLQCLIYLNWEIWFIKDLQTIIFLTFITKFIKVIYESNEVKKGNSVLLLAKKSKSNYIQISNQIVDVKNDNLIDN